MEGLMNHDALERLRLDRRLIKRRGWISGSDLEQALAELPDVSDKVAPPDEDSDSGAPEDARPAGE
jgi:hypothetical protein